MRIEAEMEYGYDENEVLGNPRVWVYNESFPPRKEAKIGDILSDDIIAQYVRSLHRNEEDFYDGDLEQRVYEFSKYKLMEVKISKINIDEYDLDIDYMKDYIKEYRNNQNYPPIVLDGDTQWSWGNNYTIIDGTHRVNALHRLKIDTVKAWVGQ